MAWLISMSLTGCAARKLHVIESNHIVIPVQKGGLYVAPMDGWFMSDALYLRYRNAVADKIQEEQAK